MKAYILNSVYDARHCIHNKLYHNAKFFSTHSSVDIYMQKIFGIECRCVTSIIDSERGDLLKRRVSSETDLLLGKLDSAFAEQLNRELGLGIEYFRPLYSYAGKLHFLGYEYFTEALREILDRNEFEEIIFYDYFFSEHLNIPAGMGNYLDFFFPTINKKIISYKNSILKNGALFKNPRCILREVANRGSSLSLRRMKESLRMKFNFKKSKFRNDKKTILVQEPLYDLSFMMGELGDFNILYYPLDADFPLGFKTQNRRFNYKFDLPGFAIKDDSINHFFAADIISDFNSNINRYLAAIDLLRDIHKKQGICLGIWGNSPYKGTKALICEYLRSNKINVIGSQHGAVYGDSCEPWHFDSDLNRCNYFLSYGFLDKDLMRIYPESDIRTKVIPVGKSPQFNDVTKKKNIDILFPLTNSISIFGGGTLRIPPHELTQRQIFLLRYLDSLKDIKVYVKPFPGSGYGNCSVLPVLSSLKNISVVKDISLIAFLNKYNPRVILLDLPSTPLYEVIGLDAEIFLMDDKCHTFDRQALEMLERRVHFSRDQNEIVSKIGAFLNGEITSKRDESFRNYYVRKQAKNLILDFIAEKANY